MREAALDQVGALVLMAPRLEDTSKAALMLTSIEVWKDIRFGIGFALISRR